MGGHAIFFCTDGVLELIIAGHKLRTWPVPLLPPAGGRRTAAARPPPPPHLESEAGSLSGGSPQTDGTISLTSLVSSLLTAENGALMGILLILTGLDVNCQPTQTSITSGRYRSPPPPPPPPSPAYARTPPSSPSLWGGWNSSARKSAEKISLSGRSFLLNCERGGIDQQ